MRSFGYVGCILSKGGLQYLAVFWAIECISCNSLAPHLFKSLSLQRICFLKNTRPAHRKLKAFHPDCFWSRTLYTVLFDHACRRLPGHQSSVSDRTRYPTVILAWYLPVGLGIIWLFSDLPFAAHGGCLVRILSVFHHGSSQPGYPGASWCPAEICLLLEAAQAVSQSCS